MLDHLKYDELPDGFIGGDLNTLGIVNSLAAGGVPTTVLATDATEPAMRSSCGRKTVNMEYKQDPRDGHSGNRATAPAGVAARAQVCDAYFRRDDPLPALDLIGRRLKSRLFG